MSSMPKRAPAGGAPRAGAPTSRAAPPMGRPAGRATNGSGASAAQMEELNSQVMEMKLTVEGLEKERDFYFGQSLSRFSSYLILGFVQPSSEMWRSCARRMREWVGTWLKRFNNNYNKLPAVFNESFSRSWIFSTRQRMDSPCPMRTMFLHLPRRKKNTRNAFTQRWKNSTYKLYFLFTSELLSLKFQNFEHWE